MKCTVKFKLNQVTCPGTLHLPDRNPVYLTLCLFGRFQCTQHVYPSFPMVFNAKLKFQRIFTNAKTPEHVLEILEDENILIELRQHTRGYKGGRVLAQFEESARKFLYPSPSYIPKEDHLKRDILLCRTENFSVGRGLDPQLSFRTKTCLGETPSILETSYPNVSTNKQVPVGNISQTISRSYTPVRSILTSRKKKKMMKKKNSTIQPVAQPQFESTESEEDNFIKANPKGNTDFFTSTKASQHKHCICECPLLQDDLFDINEWIDSISLKRHSQTPMVKPFRTGKAPENLLSNRQLSTPTTEEKKIPKKGFCRYCVVPMRNCVLCNAYKTVYGLESFLKHRFERVKTTPRSQRENITTEKLRTSSDVNQPTSPGYPKHSIAADNNLHVRSKSNPDALFHKISKPKNIRADFIPPESSSSQSSYDGHHLFPPRARVRVHDTSSSDEDHVLNGPVLTTRHAHARSPLFTPGRSYHSVEANERESHNMGSERIHQRIKELMRKNNSALQNDLSSSDTLTDDEDNDMQRSRKSLEEPPKSTSSRRSLPANSIVVPLSGDKYYWSSRSITDGRSHRDILDSNLKSIYRDMYEKTLKTS